VEKLEFQDDHLDPTVEVSLEAVKSRAVKGVAVLTGRTFLLSILSLVATGFLTVFLNPSEFGVFWIISAVVNFLAYFSDVGLAAALIQKKENVNSEELKTTFTIQQLLVVLLLVILFAATPFLQRYYAFGDEGKLLLYALGISLLMSSLKTIPSVLLERELDFPKLVFPQVLENLAYNLVAVYFAWKGFGIRSFTYAVLVRGFVGLVGIYLMKPWMPGISFAKKPLKKLLNFGVPYQLNTFLAVVKDDGLTAFLGGILGTAGIGFLGWAQKWSQYPLRLFMDHVLKVTFPAFSRMQDDERELSQSVTRAIFFVCFLVFPAVAGLLIIAPILVEIIPKYDKWRPALIPLMLISVNTFFAAGTTQLTNLLNAIGKIRITFKLMVMWTTLTWGLVPYLALKHGVNGAGLGYAIVGTSSIVAIFAAYRQVKFNIFSSMIVPLFGTLVMISALLLLKMFLPVNLTSIWVLISVGGLVYAIVMQIFVGKSIWQDAKRATKLVFKRN